MNPVAFRRQVTSEQLLITERPGIRSGARRGHGQLSMVHNKKPNYLSMEIIRNGTNKLQQTITA